MNNHVAHAYFHRDCTHQKNSASKRCPASHSFYSWLIKINIINFKLSWSNSHKLWATTLFYTYDHD